MPKVQAPNEPLHSLPSDFESKLLQHALVQTVWASLTPLARNEWICWVCSANKAETRAKRIVEGIEKMQKGMRRPCCWPGCPHRAKGSAVVKEPTRATRMRATAKTKR